MRFLKTASGCFCFGVGFYDTQVQKICKSPVCYSNKMHRASVYGAHGVWYANVLCTPVLSLVEHTGAV